MQGINPIALRKAKIVYNFGLSECSGVKDIAEVFASTTVRKGSEYCIKGDKTIASLSKISISLTHVGKQR